MSRNASSHQPNVCIYAVVDVSGSMQGSKIGSVCTTIKDMFNTWPDSVLFDLTLFNDKAEKIFTALKSKLQIHEIVRKIQDKCAYGGGTALYDAWGDMLTSIPDAVLASEETQIFILTDGEDNMSSRYTLNDVLELTKRRISSNAQFTLIDVGKSNIHLTNSINSVGKSQMQAMNVDNSASGIKTALQSVNSNILTSIRSTQLPKSNPIDNRKLTTPSAVTATIQSQHPLLSTVRKAPTTSVTPKLAHSSTNDATTSKKMTSLTANKTSHPTDSNVSYVLK
ncbi:uncharacterized protein LOC119066183 [Bradysia coprophila]|uniref:uncharacterized protein LOC119066183 n=1 Tax=Bradysia coprophila TaxID=38358 RepID=UPI00187DCF79|nr:uncharacterized protein LOC119066183 [Bradysia coprophila]